MLPPSLPPPLLDLALPLEPLSLLSELPQAAAPNAARQAAASPAASRVPLLCIPVLPSSRILTGIIGMRRRERRTARCASLAAAGLRGVAAKTRPDACAHETSGPGP